MTKRIWVVFLSVLATSACAFGQITDTYWTVDGTGGSYSYTGGTAALVGSNIEVTSVADATNSDTAGYTVYDVLGNDDGGASLAFTSGAGDGTWSWGSGGTLTVTGCLSTNGTTCIAGESKTTVLITDDFTSAGVTSIGGGKGFSFGGLQGTIDAAAATLLGVSQSFVSPASQFSTKVSGLPGTAGGSFSGVTDATPGGTLDLFQAVPEGWSLLSSVGIFAFGLIIFGIARRLGLIKAVTF